MPSALDWFIVVNPASGGGRAARRWPALALALRRAGVRFEFAETRHPGHAAELTRAAIGRGFRRLLAVGGDGALHEVVNGAMSQQQVSPGGICIGAAPLGSGNDWARSRRIPGRPEATAACIAAARTVPHDVGRLEFPEESGPGRTCFFVNVAGAGFDAFVLERLPARVPRKLAYILGLLRSLGAYEPSEFHIVADGAASRARLLLALLALGPYCGGGMRLAPDARPDDGLLDLVTVGPLRLPGDLVQLPRLFDGRLPAAGIANYQLAREVRIAAWPRAAVQADGQLVGRTPIVATVLPAAIMALTA